MTVGLDHDYLRPKKGGILRFNASAVSEVLAPGSSGQALVIASGLPVYGYPAGLTIASAAVGDLLYFDGTNWVRLATANRGLLESTTAGAPKWTAVAPAQGNILYYNGTDWVVLAVGTAGQALITGGAAANPSWGPAAWSAYTPTITAGAGAFTTVSAAGRAQQVGKTLYFSVTITITTNGTAASFINLPLPSGYTAQANTTAVGRAGSVSGKMVQWSIAASGTSGFIVNYDNTYPGATGEVITVSGVVEVT